jgi:outer membrane protein assembly factor BamB
VTGVTDLGSGSTCALRLDWTAGTSNCPTGRSVVYNVYRSTTSGFIPDPAANLVAACLTSTAWDDTSVAVDATYHYVVRAEDSTTLGGGPCNNGNQESNVVELAGVVASFSEGASQDGATDPLEATSGTATADLLPATTVSSATAASLSYTVGHTGSGGGSETLTAADFTAAASSTTSVLLTPDATTPAGSVTSATFSYTVSTFHNKVSGATLTHVGSGNSTPLNPPTANGTPVTTNVTTFCDTNGAGTYQLAITMSNKATQVSGVSLVISSGSAGDPETCAQVELLDPDGAATVVKAYGAADANPYDVLASYTGAGTYQVRVSEDCGGTASITGASLSVDGTTCSTASVEALQFFTATSTSGENLLEWQAPSAGTCDVIRVVRSTTGYPSGPTDGVLVGGAEVACGGLNTHGSVADTGLTNGTHYYYAAFVGDGAGTYSVPRQVTGRPQDVSGASQWVFNTGATALTPPGIGSVYGVSNDRCLHSMTAGSTGGMWPTGWSPMAMNAPAQERPPVINFGSGAGPGGASKVTFLGSQDGLVYAINAETGVGIWQSADYGMVQASPAGIFTHYGGVADLVLVGTRNAGADNVFHGLRVADGSPAWSFDNGGGAGGIGIISGKAAVEYDTSRVYFASRERSGGSAASLWCLEFDGSSASLCAGSWPVAVGDVDGSPMVRDGVVYVGTNASLVYAVDADTGAEMWSAPFDCADGPVKGFVWADPLSDLLYVSTTNTLWSLTDNGATVSQNWSLGTVANPSVPLVLLMTNYVIVGSSDGSLYQVDITGPSTTSVQIGDGGAAVGSPAYDVRNDLAYVGTESGAVYAVSVPLP